MQPPSKINAASRPTLASVVSTAFGAASLCMLPVLGALVSPTHISVYHLVGPASALFVPALFNLALLTLVLALLLWFAKPFHRFGVFVWSACIFSMPWVLMKGTVQLYELHMSHHLSLAVFAVCMVCILLSTLLWSSARGPMYLRGVRVGTALLGLAAIFGGILTVQTCWFGWQARHLNDPATGAASAFGPSANTQAPPAHPRVLWIIFDELAHDQVYGSRFPGLALPNLDRFAAQSNVFTDVQPAYTYTEIAIPALMSDVHGNAIRASADGQHVEFRVTPLDQHPAVWRAFDQHHTVFADAQSMGYRPAVVGWFNPYCRILPSVLTSCYWTNQSPLSNLFPARNIRANLFHPLGRLLADIPRFFFPRHFHNTDPDEDAHLHIDDYNDIYRQADKTLADPSLDFVFLHLPIPHPNGIYDRRHGVLTTGPSTYIDNLALVDKYLGHVRQVLEQQHAWDSTTVVIMGDHSWRTQMIWMQDSRWSGEDQRASHGQYDSRPYYAVKLPNQQTQARIEAPFAAVRTQALLDNLLRRQLTTPGQLELWTQSR
jgi:hypothetical protein